MKTKQIAQYLGNKAGLGLAVGAVVIIGSTAVELAAFFHRKISGAVRSYLGPTPSLSDKDED